MKPWRLFNYFTPLWRANDFSDPELVVYSKSTILVETRRGLCTLCLTAALLMAAQALLYLRLGFGSNYIYTYSLLMLLATHIALFSKTVTDLTSLYLLAITMLVVSGTAFVLLFQYSGHISIILLAAVALLFTVVPMVPWGLREGSITVTLIYMMFTLSTWGMRDRFSEESMWTLQFIMLGASIVSLVLVARNVRIHKDDIEARYDLECSRKRVLSLSQQDPLTGTWNRRFLQQIFNKQLKQWHDQDKVVYFAFLDVDNFKMLNDSLGHDCGDQLLRYLSDVYHELLDDTGFVIRMGGDEFALFYTTEQPIKVLEHGLEILQKILGREYKDCAVQVGVSGGVIAVSPGNAVTKEQVYKAADIALYEAKKLKGKDDSNGHFVLSTFDAVSASEKSA